MFPVFNRLAKQQQEQDRVEYTVEDAGLNARQLSECVQAMTPGFRCYSSGRLLRSSHMAI